MLPIHLDYLYRGYRRNIELIGEKGNLYCDFFKNTIKIYGDQNKLLLEDSFPDFERNDMYLNMLKYYIERIKDNEEIKPDLSEGLKSAGIAAKVLTDNKLI